MFMATFLILVTGITVVSLCTYAVHFFIHAHYKLQMSEVDFKNKIAEFKATIHLYEEILMRGKEANFHMVHRLLMKIEKQRRLIEIWEYYHSHR
jgi:hypothetical protein